MEYVAKVFNCCNNCIVDLYKASVVRDELSKWAAHTFIAVVFARNLTALTGNCEVVYLIDGIEILMMKRVLYHRMCNSYQVQTQLNLLNIKIYM